MSGDAINTAVNVSVKGVLTGAVEYQGMLADRTDIQLSTRGAVMVRIIDDRVMPSEPRFVSAAETSEPE